MSKLTLWKTKTLRELKGGPLHIKGESWPSSYIWLLNKKSGIDMQHMYTESLSMGQLALQYNLKLPIPIRKIRRLISDQAKTSTL